MNERHPLVQALAVTGRLPRAEIAAAMEHIDAIKPDLLAAVERAADGRLDSEADETLAFVAMHILGAVREPGLHAPLMRLLRLPELDLDAFLADAVAETIPKVIAGAFNGNADDLFLLATDLERPDYLRSTVMAAIGFLTWAGRIDAERTRDFLVRVDDERRMEPKDTGWFAWSSVIENLGWGDLAPRVEQAFADGRIWGQFGTFEDFCEGLAETERAAPGDVSRFERASAGYLGDVVEELNRFRFEPLARESFDSDQKWSFAQPVRNPMRNVGRNDPCPCGSGKKYKKCCLRAA
jgi:uncharacterized protein